MKKVLLFVLASLLSLALSGCTDTQNQTPAPKAAADTSQDEEQAVTKLVEDFGKKLQNVSLLAPEEVVKKSMQENYGDLVTPELLSKWQSDPQNAPGRLVSSPWPDRIDVLSAEKISDDSYQVTGEIIEMTSMEMEKGGYAAKRPVTLAVKKVDGSWLIDDVTLGDYEQEGSLLYQNTEYGFDFTLPGSWKGYTIETGEWEGLSVSDSQGEKVVQKGPMLSIRHPLWTSENPRQDIPVMVFTIDQWDQLQNDKFHIGAAPIGPKELERNSRYVFALPARYNYAFPTGFEEVEDILNGNALKPTEDFSTAKQP